MYVGCNEYVCTYTHVVDRYLLWSGQVACSDAMHY